MRTPREHAAGFPDIMRWGGGPALGAFLAIQATARDVDRAARRWTPNERRHAARVLRESRTTLSRLIVCLDGAADEGRSA